jgi:hypothetical protein
MFCCSKRPQVFEPVAPLSCQAPPLSIRVPVLEPIELQELPSIQITSATLDALLDPTSIQGPRPTDALRFAPPLEILECLRRDSEAALKAQDTEVPKQGAMESPAQGPKEGPAEEQVPSVVQPAPDVLRLVAVRANALNSFMPIEPDCTLSETESGECSDDSSVSSSGWDWFKGLKEQE